MYISPTPCIIFIFLLNFYAMITKTNHWSSSLTIDPICIWLILCQSFHKLKNMVKFYKEFIFVITERINMQISSFCHTCDRKREFDVILIHGLWMMCLTTGAFRIPKSRKDNHIQSCVIHQNDIIFFFLIAKVTKCWNLHVDTFNNNKYKFRVRLRQNESIFMIFIGIFDGCALIWWFWCWWMPSKVHRLFSLTDNRIHRFCTNFLQLTLDENTAVFDFTLKFGNRP